LGTKKFYFHNELAVHQFYTKLSNPDGKIADQRTAIAALTIKVYVLN